MNSLPHQNHTQANLLFLKARLIAVGNYLKQAPDLYEKNLHPYLLGQGLKFHPKRLNNGSQMPKYVHGLYLHDVQAIVFWGLLGGFLFATTKLAENNLEIRN